MSVKSITITQPFASLIAIGAKTRETRSWAPRHIGPLAIHAGKSLEFMYLCSTEPFRTVLLRHQLHAGNLPMGRIVAIARLAQNDPVEGIRDRLSLEERHFGDYTDGRYAWLLENVRPLRQPIEVRGAQGLWDWECPEALLQSYLQETSSNQSRNRRVARPMADARDQ